MGSFNCTCIVSNLPIESGDKVRFLALARSAFHQDGNDHVCYVDGRWQLHGVPIKAEYNDYGSVDEIEESLTTRVFFEALKRGSVEKGVGDNQCHDVQVRADMSQKSWLEALWEGRVEVEDQRRLKDWILSKYEPPVGVPSLRRIEKVLTDAGTAVTTEYGAEGYVLDEVSSGFLRVRYGQHHRDSSELEKVLPFIHAAGYAAMITVGTGNYSNHSEILVAPLPPTDPNVHIHSSGLVPDHSERTYQPRPVAQAMIREDVWQILCQSPIDIYDKTYTIEDLRKSALEAVEEELALKAKQASMTDQERAAEVFLRLSFELGGRQDNKFLYYLGGHEGLSGYTLRKAYQLGLEMFENPEEIKAYVLDLADTLYVQWAYSTLYGQWHPTTNGSQNGNWKAHREFRLKLAQIRGRYEDGGDEGEADAVGGSS